MKLDEDHFLGQILPRLQHATDLEVPPGDDCAAIRLDAHGDRLLLLAVDQVVAGTHYLYAETEPRLIGHKLLARNLSDIAAMGGIPRFALVAGGFPPDTQQERALAVMEGIIALAEAHHVAVIGGDVGRCPNEVLSLTIIGEVEREFVCRRNGARSGDLIFVTGVLGGSFPSGHHLQFAPRLAEGRWLAREKYATAMIDVSDGLFKDLQRILTASGCAAHLDPRDLPCRNGFSPQSALFDGEDYELLFTVSAERATALVREWPFDTALTQIGRITTDRSAGTIVDPAGREIGRIEQAFNHFSSNNSAQPSDGR